MDDSRDRRGSRSPGSVAASAKAASAYTVNAPSVYRAPALAPPAAAAPAPPSLSSKDAADALAGAIAVASMEDEGGAEAGGAESAPAPAVGGTEHENMASHQAVAGDSSTEALSSGAWGKGNLRLGGERVTSIPRDGSTLDVCIFLLFVLAGPLLLLSACGNGCALTGDGAGVCWFPGGL